MVGTGWINGDRRAKAHAYARAREGLQKIHPDDNNKCKHVGPINGTTTPGVCRCSQARSSLERRSVATDAGYAKVDDVRVCAIASVEGKS